MNDLIAKIAKKDASAKRLIPVDLVTKGPFEEWPTALCFYSTIYPGDLIVDGRAALLDFSNTDGESTNSWFRELCETPAELVLLSSGEGGGGYVFDSLTGAVFNIDFSDIERIARKDLAPTWASFEEFLHWYVFG